MTLNLMADCFRKGLASALNLRQPRGIAEALLPNPGDAYNAYAYDILSPEGGVWKGNRERRLAFLCLFFVAGVRALHGCMCITGSIPCSSIRRMHGEVSQGYGMHSAITLDPWRPCDWLFDLVFDSLFLSPLRAERSHRRGWFSLSKKG